MSSSEEEDKSSRESASEQEDEEEKDSQDEEQSGSESGSASHSKSSSNQSKSQASSKKEKNENKVIPQVSFDLPAPQPSISSISRQLDHLQLQVSAFCQSLHSFQPPAPSVSIPYTSINQREKVSRSQQFSSVAPLVKSTKSQQVDQRNHSLHDSLEKHSPSFKETLPPSQPPAQPSTRPRPDPSSTTNRFRRPPPPNNPVRQIQDLYVQNKKTIGSKGKERNKGMVASVPQDVLGDAHEGVRVGGGRLRDSQLEDIKNVLLNKQK